MHVLGDRSALRKGFTNLLTNAIKYGGRGNRVTLRAREEEGTVETSVEDRGPGIRPEDLPHIFEPFYRGREVPPGRSAVPVSGSPSCAAS